MTRQEGHAPSNRSAQSGQAIRAEGAQLTRQTRQGHATPLATATATSTPFGGREPVDVEAIKRAHPLLTVLERYGVVTYGAGARRTALCPFHDDHEPSLTIFLDSDRFHCFGCGATGDVIELVERLEGVGFLEAVRRLNADNALKNHGVRGSPDGNSSALRRTSPSRRWATLAPDSADAADGASGPAGGPHESGRPTDTDTCTDTDTDAGTGVFPQGGALGPPWHPLAMQLALLTTAATLYRETLLQSPQATAYLEHRGISPDVARAAYLGYADGDGLARVLAQAPALLPSARRLGLIDTRGRDALRGRLILPEVRGGLCIWLHGRALPGTREAPAEDGVPAVTTTATATATPPGSGRHMRTNPKYLGCALEKPLLGAGLCEQYGIQARATRGLYHGPVRPGVVVVEGSFDLLTFLGWRLPMRCVALIGTFASTDQFRHLVALAAGGPIWIALDADLPGEAGAERLRKQLASYPHGVERLLPPFGAKDFAEVATVAGARERLLRALAKHRCSGEAGQVSTIGEGEPTASPSRPSRAGRLQSPTDGSWGSQEANT